MKKTLLLVAFAMSLATANVGFAQNALSSQDRQILTEQLLRNKATAAAMGGTLDTRNILYVPIVFHLVAKNDGTGRVQESNVVSMICVLNGFFANQNIQFYLRPADATMPILGTNYINNDILFDASSSPAGISVAVQNKRLDALNIFVVNDISTRNGSYYVNSLNGIPYGADFIVLNKSKMNNDATPVARSLGYFFALLNTHNGWDEFPARYSQNAVPVNSPGGVPTELVARTNCGTAGDYLCDTPADYNGINSLSFSCDDSLNWYDPTRARLKAHNNLMGSFEHCHGYTFSEMQKTMIRTDLTTNPQRSYIRRGVTPTLTNFRGLPTVVSPLDGAVQPLYNYVQLSWNAIPGATGYTVEISRSAIFDFGYTSFYSATNNFGVDNALVRAGQPQMMPNTRYFWRIRPIAPYVARWSGCPEHSTLGSFKTGVSVSTQELSNLSSLRVLPNPTEAGKDLTILATMNENLEGTIRLTDVAGKLVRSEKRTFVAGENQITWSTNDLSAGLYILSIAGKEGITSQKVVVTK